MKRSEKEPSQEEDTKLRQLVDDVHMAVRHRNSNIDKSGRWTCVCIYCEKIRAIAKEYESP